MHDRKPSVRDEEIKRYIAEATLENQARWEYSKPTDFFLTYESPDGPVLDDMIAVIVHEIEQWEKERPDNPRKKKRPADAHRRFKKVVRVLVLNTLHARRLAYGIVQLAVSLDANTYNLKGR